MFKGHLEVKDDKQHPGSTGKHTIHCEGDKPEKNKRINSSNLSEINKRENKSKRYKVRDETKKGLKQKNSSHLMK